MAEATLNDVIIRLRDEGNLDRNSGTNSLKSLKMAVLQSDKTFKDGFGELLDFFKGNSLKDLEAKREQDEFNKDLLDALEGLKPSDKPSAPDTPGGGGGMGLGLIGMGIAASLGGIAGLLAGQFKAIQTFAKLFTPESLMKNLRGMRVGIAMQMELFKQAVTERLASVRAGISNGIERIKTFFTIGEDSNIGKALASFKARVAILVEPFKTAADTIMDLFRGTGAPGRISGIFNTIKTYLGMFGNTVGRVASIVGKIFAPIAIVMTAFETIKGAIDGFIEDGIIGGIEGAITGFFNSLIFGPIDLIKDGIAWVLDKFGFENAASVLNSFSFTESFTSVVETLFYPFQWVQDKATEIVNGLTEWFSSKLDAVKNFFGFGRDDTEAELEGAARQASRDIRTEERRLTTLRRAAEQGNVTVNGRQATEAELAELIARREEAVAQAIANYEDAEDALTEFKESSTLMDMLTDTVTSVKDWIVDTFNNIVEGIKNFDVKAALGDLSQMAGDFIKGLLRAVLPSPDALSFEIPSVSILGKTIGGGTINLNPIPDSVYQFAGLDPATGELLPPSNGGGSAANGAELAAAGAENGALASNRQAANNTIVGGSTNVQQVTNNQTTVAPTPAPSRRPDAMDDAYFMPAG